VEDRHRLDDVARTAPLRASTTLWSSPNRFGRCLSLEVIGARQLPAAREINLGLQAGNRPVVPIPLLQSQADIAAGGRGRLDGGRLTSRINGVLLDGTVDTISLHLQLVLPHRWFPRTQHLVAHAPLTSRWAAPGTPGSATPEWIPLLSPDAAASSASDRQESGHFLPVAASGGNDELLDSFGPALLVRLQCFKPEDLDRAESRARLFRHYSSDGEVLRPNECDKMLSDVAGGWRLEAVEMSVEQEAAEEERKRGWCQSCVAHFLAMFGCYVPEVSMVRYLTHYHTLLWVFFGRPGDYESPVLHRFYFLILSMSFNMFVVVLFCATDVSLLAIHCPVEAECTPVERWWWRVAQVGLVAIIDTAFWPLLKPAFFFFQARLHHTQYYHDRKRWLRVLWALLFAFTLGVLWVAISASRHVGELTGGVFEFLSTWPSARMTEAFKLMVLWGMLRDGYGLRRPVSPIERKSTSIIDDETEDDGGWAHADSLGGATDEFGCPLPPSHPPPSLPLQASQPEGYRVQGTGIAHQDEWGVRVDADSGLVAEADAKTVPLLSDQRGAL